MKTTEIKYLLKKPILVVELPEGAEITAIGNGHEVFYAVKDYGKESYTKIADGKQWKLLGKRDEIKEEDAEKLVEKDPWVMSFKSYRDYSSKKVVKYNTLITALESFNSALEKEIHWVNPCGDRIPIFVEASPSAFKFVEKEKERWKEAQEKTFDRNRSIILFKQ